MSIAFLQFSDPYSWLIRGFVEAEWEDLTLSSGQILPQRTGAGFDLRHLIQTGGRFGIRVVIMAVDMQNNWFQQDQMYVFDIVFGQDNIGKPAYLASSKDTGFSEFFPLSDYNPLLTVEQLIEKIHKRHVPQFVEERKKGKMVNANDINGMYTTRPAPVDQMLLQFLYQRTQMGLSFDTALSEGLWSPAGNQSFFSQNNMYNQGMPQQSLYNQQSPPPLYQRSVSTAEKSMPPTNAPEQISFQQPQIQQPQIHQQIQQQVLQPMINSGISVGGGMGAMISGGNVIGDTRTQGIRLLENPAKALEISSYAGMLFGVAEFVNSVLIFMKLMSGNMVVPSKPYYFTLFAVHMAISLYCIAGGGAAYFFSKEYKQIGSRYKAMFAMIYPSTIPICCITGIPITLWAFFIWNKPEIKALQK